MTEEANDSELEFDFDDDEPEIEIIDDTPPEDRGKTPLPKEVVDEIEGDELGEYSEKVKQRILQYKKHSHDQRRRAEKAERENREAIATAQRLLAENRRYRSTLTEGESAYIESVKHAAAMELEVAKRAFREAQDLGDTNQITDAQEKLSEAVFKSQQATNYRPTLQAEENVVKEQEQAFNPPKPDAATVAWQEKNEWFGADSFLTAAALGLHQSLVQERGAQFAGTDEYWKTIDASMRKHFPEHFGNEEPAEPAVKPAKASPVAPATRSRSPKTVKLTQSQVNLAKKLGITPEQYAKEMLKLEKQNG